MLKGYKEMNNSGDVVNENHLTETRLSGGLSEASASSSKLNTSKEAINEESPTQLLDNDLRSLHNSMIQS